MSTMNKKVLIIEDDANFAENLKEVFTKKKIDVKISTSAQQAENMISFGQYDLLVVDVILPKVNGIDFLKQIISKGLLSSHCAIWVMSGVLSRRIVSKDMASHIDDFFQKPLNMKSFEQKVDSLFAVSRGFDENIKFFYLEQKDGKNLLEEKEYIITGHELMFVCFYLCFAQFNGVLNIAYSGVEEKDEILFKDGNIHSFKSVDERSYLGALLIKNNLISNEDMKLLLEEESDVPLGERLVANCYISPHQLHKMLRKQMAIRLFRAMEYPTVVVSCYEFISSVQFNHFANLEMRDFLSLVYNWIHSKVTVEWLKEFFNDYREMRIKPLKALPGVQKLFNYSDFEFLKFDFKTNMETVSDVLNNIDKKQEDVVRTLYCRLLLRLNCIEEKTKKDSVDKDYHFMKKKYTNFLKEAKLKNYFELLNLPVNATVGEIEESYKNMVKVFHPDRRGHNIPADVAEICDQCFILVKKIYQTLIDPKEKQAYLGILEKQIKDSGFSVRTTYMKGKKYLEEGQYSEALNEFQSIINCKTAPGDILLYYVWSMIKKKQLKMSKEEIDKIIDIFGNVGLESRQGALFFFVKGLFMKVRGKKQNAFDLFAKALILDSKFTVARIEQYSLGLSKKNKNFLSGLFKKGA